MSLRDRITQDMKTAMREQNKSRLAAIRLILADIKKKEIDEQTTLDDAAIMALLSKMVKQRRDAITQYESANRPELAEKEAAEIEVIEHYLPKAASEDEVQAIIAEAIAQTDAASIQDMGKVMGIVKTKLAGRADMGQISQAIKAKLS
ncbi:MAG: glutamyl-tRNA amidotransferase [Gammaproteobacteria bacterium CG11_big_fil_rev_8_21_14_0_20_46_22]|nr:MAG: glutamyl-tRNA amidotransferase [Gammaproteobacteria bacterium CG12_big_fil_rev_8_21_14_0_65_46_12]PIR10276.1 MAG: glutamyl-tRNA amidotransferase [Gammaproteobacteria bacterium CG11_big_fil_rev_8_21_14_0_20_46_22]